MELALSTSDVKLIVNAINWTLNIPSSRSHPPPFSETDSARLQAVMEDLLHLLPSCESSKVVLTESCLQHARGAICSTPSEIQAIIACVHSFANEIGHSPTEVAAVTGLPFGALESLVSRLAAAGSKGPA